MLRKDTRRKKHRIPLAEINVVSLMDILTTLLFFLILSANFVEFGAVQAKSSSPEVSTQSDPKPVFALDITLKSPTSARIYLGPIAKLKFQKSDQLNGLIQRQFKGNERLGYLSTIEGRSTKEMIAKLQGLLIPIKQSFPHETKAVLSLADPLVYEDWIQVMNGIQSMGDEGKAFPLTNALGKTEKTVVLFPTVLVSEMGRFER